MINVVQKYLKLIHLSDLVHCNGKTLCGEVLSPSEENVLDPTVTFPMEKPTKKDKEEWRNFILSLTEDGKVLTKTLDDYLKNPQVKIYWKYNPERKSLIKYDAIRREHVEYRKDTEGRRLRSVATYDRKSVATQISDYTHYASVTECGRDKVRIHSHIKMAVNEEE